MAAPSNMDGPPTPRPKMVSFHRATSPMSIINDRSPVTRPRVAIEAAPLLKTRSPPEDWDEEDEEESKSTLYLFLLTLSGLGLQIAWSVETSNGSVSRPSVPSPSPSPDYTSACLACSQCASPIFSLLVLASLSLLWCG